MKFYRINRTQNTGYVEVIAEDEVRRVYYPVWKQSRGVDISFECFLEEWKQETGATEAFLID